jgi:sigma54-dependent transcription regulator
MNGLDDARLAALAARLRLAPRELLALAGRIAAVPDLALDAQRLDGEIARLRSAADATGNAAALALLGYQPYALDDLDTALRILWSPPRAQGT